MKLIFARSLLIIGDKEHGRTISLYIERLAK